MGFFGAGTGARGPVTATSLDRATSEAAVAATRFAKDRFGNSLTGIVLAGSRLYGRANISSDLDIVAVLLNPVRQRIVRRFGDVIVDLNAMFFVEVQRAMRQAHAPGILECMARGSIFFDVTNFTESLCREARTIFEIGPPIMTAPEIETTRGRLTGELRCLPSAATPGGRLQCAEVLRRALAIYFRANRKWLPNIKNTFEALPPELARYVEQAVTHSSHDERRDATKRALEWILQQIGGPKEEWETRLEPVRTPEILPLPDGTVRVRR